MKVVLLHDWLTGFRGGERVLEAFCEMFPDAPLYTLIHKPGSTSNTIENRKIVSSFLDKFPGVHTQYRKFLPLFPRAADSLRIMEEADLVLSSSHCVIKGVQKPAGSVHISYIHSPMRYIYDQFDNYFGPHAPAYQRFGARVVRPYLTRWDKNSNKNVDYFVANAGFVSQRISKYYGLDSDVIHPFVELKDFTSKKEVSKEDFYLMVSAFAPNKRVDLAVEAFNKMGKKLIIVGSGQQENELKSMAKSNIEFRGNLSREEVVDLYFRSKGFIFPGVEDFGITPLESLAAQTPIIAYKKGGVLETLNDDVAQFFSEASTDSLCGAVEEFETRSFEGEKLLNRAKEFSKESFKDKITDYISQKIPNWSR